MSKLEEFKKCLDRGRVYRRAELAQWSTSVDRHLAQLVKDGTLKKLSGGVYYYPEKTSFGEAPANDAELVTAYLKDHRFLINSPSIYNALGVGSTQLYNETVVYNHKRHGVVKLGNRRFDFRVKHYFPTEHSVEFLLVDLVNNLDRLAEDKESLLEGVKRKAMKLDPTALVETVREYGGVKARKFFAEHLMQDTLNYGA